MIPHPSPTGPDCVSDLDPTSTFVAKALLNRSLHLHPVSEGLSLEPKTPHCSLGPDADVDSDVALVQAADLYAAGEYLEAVELCQQLAAASHPRQAEVLVLLGAAFYQLGHHDHSVAANAAAISLNPSLAEAHANLANSLQQMGALDLAISYYGTALRLKPDFTDAYANLAVACRQRGWAGQAAQAYRAALSIDPTLTGVHCGLGDLLRVQGEAGRAAAEQCYRAALGADPRCGEAFRGLGDCSREAGALERAEECYRRALAAGAATVETYSGLGIALRGLRRMAEAEEAFMATVQLRPGCHLALGNLAGAYYENSKLEAAVTAYRRALAANPNFLEALNNLGNALRQLGRLEEAVVCYSACIQKQLAALPQGRPAADTAAAPRLGVAYNNLGGVLKLMNRPAECIVAYEHVALLQPQAAEGWMNLGSAYKDAGRHEEAMAAYRRALALRPAFPEAFANLVHSMSCVCEWHDREEMFTALEAAVKQELADGKLPSVQPFHALAYPFSAELALEIGRRYAFECMAAARALLRAADPGSDARQEEGLLLPLPHPPAAALRPGERLRVGYVSSDFGNHPLAHLMGSVFGLQDRSAVEVFCYALSPDDGSEWRRRVADEAEHFLDVSSWDSLAVARRIAADGVHVAVNLNGFTKGARNEIFALRPAPVQASLLGFPATMGADFIPWVILDKQVCPSESRACYSESVAYMPDSYFVNDYRRGHPDVLEREGGAAAVTRADVGLPEDKVVFSCFNQLYKMDPEIFSVWCSVLKRVPNSVLWLLRFPPAGEARVRSEAAARGIDPSRIIFTDVAPKPLHIARSGLADVFLDTPTCNAHTTACDVLWAGTPIVTCPGQRMASRVAASLCRATGLGDAMVVESMEEYEERAVRLGNDGDERRALRDALREARTSCALFDIHKWVSGLDRVLLRMWEIHCEGKGPRDFEI